MKAARQRGGGEVNCWLVALAGLDHHKAKAKRQRHKYATAPGGRSRRLCVVLEVVMGVSLSEKWCLGFGQLNAK